MILLFLVPFLAFYLSSCFFLAASSASSLRLGPIVDTASSHLGLLWTSFDLYIALLVSPSVSDGVDMMTMELTSSSAAAE